MIIFTVYFNLNNYLLRRVYLTFLDEIHRTMKIYIKFYID